MTENREQSQPQSHHFQLEAIADGVYAAIANDDGYAVGNAGIVDLGDQTLVFDTFITPQAARDLRVVAEHLTGREVTWVVNSHYHNDHIRGNQVFSIEAGIIATEQTRALIRTKGMNELHWDSENAPMRLQELEDQIAAEEEADKRSGLELLATYFRGVNGSLEGLKLRLPDHTFDRRMAVHGTARAVEIVTFGGGHTESDAILFLPDEGIGFMGDLLFVGCHPYLADGDPDEWLRSLEQVATLDLKTLVPGHGPVGTPGDLDLIYRYITDTMALAEALVENGETVENAVRQKVPRAYNRWRFSNFFATNMRFLYRRLCPEPEPELEIAPDDLLPDEDEHA